MPRKRLPRPNCIDCGKQLKQLNSLRCMSCAGKARKPRQKPLILNCPQCGKTCKGKNGFHGKRGLCRSCTSPLVGQSRSKCRVELKCPQCNVIFKVQPSIAQKNDRTFCSKKCYSKYLTNITGDKVPNWRGGTIKYYGPNWRQQKRLCRKRDDYTCQNCGKSQKDNRYSLDVHHVKPFKSFGYIVNENTNYLLANHLDNLISLCRSCHSSIEPRRNTGYKINFQTPESF